MSFKKWMSLAMMIVLLLTGVVGCKKSDADEESAVTDEYVESDAPATETETDLPQKVENSGKTYAEPSEPEPEEETPTEEDPGDEPAEETPTEEQPAEQEPAEETPAEEDPEVSYDEKNKLKVISYNVRCADDGENKMVAQRGPRLEKVVDQYDPDVMGFQEVTPTWRLMLEGYFSDEYEYAYQERSPGGECTPIFWKKDKFELMESDHFWLSETPEVSSKGWGAEHYRVVTWVRLKLKSTGKEFLYFNTHYDFKNEIHINSSKLILSRAKAAGAFSKYAMILTGDFNMNAWKGGYNALVESGDLSDTNYDLDNISTPTTNGYNESTGGSIIDFCFYSPAKAVPVKYQVLNEEIDGGYVSDHRGLYTEIALL